MATFQFYVKDKTPVHLNIDSSTFLQEKYQLIEQGFEREGDIVQAASVEEAYEKFKTIYLDELQDFAHSHLFIGTVGAIGYIS